MQISLVINFSPKPGAPVCCSESPLCPGERAVGKRSVSAACSEPQDSPERGRHALPPSSRAGWKASVRRSERHRCSYGSAHFCVPQLSGNAGHWGSQKAQKGAEGGRLVERSQISDSLYPAPMAPSGVVCVFKPCFVPEGKHFKYKRNECSLRRT